MASRYEALVYAASGMQRDAWLLYLNYLLSIRRSNSFDPVLVGERDPVFVPPHVIRFLAKLITCHGTDVGGQQPTWDWYCELRDIFIELDDPIADDPAWETADPTGFFVRIHNQQIPSQDIRKIQRLGLAARLFCDLSPLRDGYSLSDAAEAVLGMSIRDLCLLVSQQHLSKPFATVATLAVALSLAATTTWLSIKAYLHANLSSGSHS